MNADKIRSIVETLGKKQELDTVTYENNEYGYSSTQFVVLREIAAQLAEHNQLARESLAAQKSEYESAARFRSDSLAATGQIREAMAPPPPPPPGTVIEANGHYGIVMEGGYVRPISEEEAMRLIEEQKQQERKPS